MALDIKWEDPPAQVRQGRPGKYLELLAELRKHPGRWARLDRASSSTASNFNSGKVAGIKPGEFEAVTRRVDGKVGIWVRYVGGTEPKVTPLRSTPTKTAAGRPILRGCFKCKENKPLTAFDQGDDGEHHLVCRDCEKAAGVAS